MNEQKLLIANRGEIAVRVLRTAQEMGLQTAAVYAADDAQALHVRQADEAIPLTGRGAAAYLDGEQLVKAAQEIGATLVHPGYGFLSEDAHFARLCLAAGLTFIGPSAEVLGQLGNKVAARHVASEANVPIVPGTDGETTIEEAAAFLASLSEGEGMMIKALAGGGGRGMKAIYTADELDAAWQQCQKEAELSFGRGDLYVEKFVSPARHIEVQILGDGTGAVMALGERECSIQRRHQKLIEIAPAPFLSQSMREGLWAAAVRIGKSVNYASVGTVEFLVSGEQFYFIEANARLQVEHTVTEEISGVDLVRFQLEVALGQTLAELNLNPSLKGQAMQLRINAETLLADGTVRPSVGTLTQAYFPSGRGVRVDTAVFPHYQHSPSYDSLLVKLIYHTASDDFATLLRQSSRALDEVSLEGIETNVGLLQAILQHPDFAAGAFSARFVEWNLEDLLLTQRREGAKKKETQRHRGTEGREQSKIQNPKSKIQAPEGMIPIHTPMPGAVVRVSVAVGDEVAVDGELGVIEAMKMEAVIRSPVGGVVRELFLEEGTVLGMEAVIGFVEPLDDTEAQRHGGGEVDLERIRPDLQELFDRTALTLDAARPEAIAKRHGRNGRTARENIADLVDAGSFKEYGQLLIAAQRTRRAIEDLRQNTPADGLVSGYATVNGELVGEENAHCMVMAYDYTVLAGTQGVFNHKKMDRLLHVALGQARPLPLIIYAEGGGGRPGDVDYAPISVATLEVMTFYMFAKLSGRVPLIAIVNGYCFAGNAALAGCADVIIATESASIGMGGPAMIEGGGLGQFHPREVGPVSVQTPNGVIDVLVKDEAEATKVAQQYLSYFQGRIKQWQAADQRQLRHLIPENRRRMYEVRQVIETLADEGSVLELRPQFGLGLITAFVRIEGRPLGLIANNPAHLGGAIDSDAADKGARFLQLCDAHGLPVLSLVDTPGFMVGPEAEQTAAVRHVSRLFVVGASLQVPFMAVVLRKGYGLGAMAMCGGSLHVPLFTIAWPTGEFGAMGLEGAVRLGFRKELEAADDPQALYEKLVAQAYDHGKGLNAAAVMEIDAVIDPAETRGWVVQGLNVAGEGKRGERPFVDTW